jgi:protoporphyrinogen oxidase
MKIAILGGGFTGLTAAYYLRKKGHQVVVFEKEKQLGGLARGFRENKWEWPLERAYHHLFANDSDILNLAKEIGFKEIIFKAPITASLFDIKDDLPHLPAGRQVFPVDTPQDFIKLPLLPLIDKLRAGSVLAFLKFSPHLSLYEKKTSAQFLKQTMGERVWRILWEPLFRKKFGKYAENILASFIWARITKRTKKLGYPEGGFQSLIDFLAKTNEDQGVVIKRGESVTNLEEVIKNFDSVVSTLPTPVMVKLGGKVFPADYLKKLSSIKFLHAVNLILETEKQILNKTYWLSIYAKDLPMMVVVQHTNFIDKKHYGNYHLAYVANYVESDDKLLKMSDEEILNYYLPHLNKITNYKLQITNYFVFKTPWAQPIFDKEFIKNKPEFITPIKNLYLANLDMTYPYDRGTNYAVKLGKEVANLI